MCECEVCAALRGIKETATSRADWLERVAERLPENARRILAAQARILRHRPHPGDVELVRAAAERCTGGTFHTPPSEN
jgi:hypothetical protein